jgi:pyridoxamine 5'-phosphate oxidase family protein
MSSFTNEEIEYMNTQRLGRLATVGANGQPHVVPVGFRYNPELNTIDIGGHSLADTRKYKNVAANPLVAFVVDDVLPPWRPRSVEVQGRARAQGIGDAAIIRISPTRIISRGLDGTPKTHSRPVAQAAE